MGVRNELDGGGKFSRRMNLPGLVIDFEEMETRNGEIHMRLLGLFFFFSLGMKEEQKTGLTSIDGTRVLR